MHILLLPLLVAATLHATAGTGASGSLRALPPDVCSGNTVKYFAFGSNLLRSKMDGRGDTQVLDCVPAVVAGHRLAFNMRMFPPLEPAMASIDPSDVDDACEGALYTLTRAGYEALWRSEGGSMERPGYEEVVVCADVGGERVRAITLRAAPWMRMTRDAPPSARYKSLIVDGARELGLSSEYVERVAALPAAVPSRPLSSIARAHGAIAVLMFKLGLPRCLLAPFRAASYALLRGKAVTAGSGGLNTRLLDLIAEFAMGAVLLPTAALGALLRIALRVVGQEHWTQFGPPPARNDAGPQDDAAGVVVPTATRWARARSWWQRRRTTGTAAA